VTFNSFEFLVFFVVVFSAYWLIRKRTPQNVLLLVASYVFYAWWDWRFLFLLIGTTIVDFVAVQKLDDARSELARKRWMIFSVTINLLILGFFKYFGFFTDSAAQLLEKLGLPASDPAVHFLLPVGISFYVFHEISYAVDVYRRRTHAERNLVTYAIYIAFFPQLVAGPITRATHMLPQFRRPRRFPNQEQVYSAAALILSGLFKKVVIADSMAPIANNAFNDPTGKGFIPLFTGMVAFSIQIYGDFAGYTDIARGVARLLGIDIPRNFEQPYLSRNITQFWRTWHISLSSFLHDYLYVPLGGNRNGKWATYRNLMITMLLGGLWHGASWTFVVWGGLHGAALAVHRARGHYETRGRPDIPTANDVMPIAGTFLFVSALWIFFRAPTISGVFDYYRGFTDGLVGSQAGAWKSDVVLVALVGLAMLAIDLVDRRRAVVNPLVVPPAWLQGGVAGAAVLALLVWGGQAPTPFIYFQF
jgi:D-alanyl-lipoteichoic acid acyltransferase DltB (MBOAT superfamily)